MNYYQFHIGDYAKHTAHLTPLEDLAYRRLLDHYYQTEQPLPADIPRLSRRLRLGSEEIEAVLDDFFVLTENGWENARCSDEIAKYNAFIEKQRAKGRLGGRPKKPAAKPQLSHGKAGVKPPNSQFPSPNSQEEEKEYSETPPDPEKPKPSVNLKPLVAALRNRYGLTPDMSGFKAALTEAVKDGFAAEHVQPSLDWLGTQTDWQYVSAFNAPNKLRDNLSSFYAKSREGIDEEEERRKLAKKILASMKDEPVPNALPPGEAAKIFRELREKADAARKGVKDA